MDAFPQAVMRGDTEACRRLLSAGADPNALAGYGPAVDPVLRVAASRGYTEIVSLLLAHGARVDGAVDELATALYSSAGQGHLDIARLLVEAGADIHRESLTQPLTPTGAAEYWSFLGENRKEVARYLRSLGGQNPYNDPNRPPDQWDGHPGELQIRFVERALAARVSPIPYIRQVEGSPVELYSCRFDNKKYLFRLLFTVSLNGPRHQEVALALPGMWPVHRAALELERFRWPLDLLARTSRNVAASGPLEHGMVLDRNHPATAGVRWPETISQWLVVAHESLEGVRRELSAIDEFIANTLGPVLLLVPHLAKKPLTPGAPAREAADAKARVKWAPPALKVGRNTLAVPLEVSAETVSISDSG